ncbi:MAG: dethiobiotin synthase [Gammaproteobacteria bacterium]|nr:dethiobiotin synthase [Gammaproteobacteria bacterium]
MKGLFITGTDTGVGKTYLGVQIAQTLYQLGEPVRPRKPLESGCLATIDGLLPADGTAYWQAVEGGEPLEVITPYCFEALVSPARAAYLNQLSLSLGELKEVCLRDVAADDFLLLEGAGGFYSPLLDGVLNADLAQAMALPVLLVAEDRLGCINQVLLSLEAIERRGLVLAGVVLNRFQGAAGSHPDLDNEQDLRRLGVDVHPLAENEGISLELLSGLLRLN